MSFAPEETEMVLGLADAGILGLRDALKVRRASGGDLRNFDPSALATLRTEVPVTASSRAALRAAGERLRDAAAASGIRWTIPGAADYPECFGVLANPPLVCWWRGALPDSSGRRIAIVGSRNASRYGLRQSRAFAAALAAAGITIISGLARGIDAAAHQGVLDEGRPNVAVLGSGLDEIYPPEHRGLAERIVAAAGGVLSEFPPSAPPLPRNFPRRNRLIAAFAEALLVVEAGRRSGALITARWALDLGRSVFVVPGQADNPLADGVLDLLRDGAVPVRNGEELLADLGIDVAAAAQDGGSLPRGAMPLGPAEAEVLALLDHEAATVDVLLSAATRSPSEMLAALMALELRGLAIQEPGMRFRRA